MARLITATRVLAFFLVFSCFIAIYKIKHNYSLENELFDISEEDMENTENMSDDGGDEFAEDENHSHYTPEGVAERADLEEETGEIEAIIKEEKDEDEVSVLEGKRADLNEDEEEQVVEVNPFKHDYFHDYPHDEEGLPLVPEEYRPEDDIKPSEVFPERSGEPFKDSGSGGKHAKPPDVKLVKPEPFTETKVEQKVTGTKESLKESTIPKEVPRKKWQTSPAPPVGPSKESKPQTTMQEPQKAQSQEQKPIQSSEKPTVPTKPPIPTEAPTTEVLKQDLTAAQEHPKPPSKPKPKQEQSQPPNMQVSEQQPQQQPVHHTPTEPKKQRPAEEPKLLPIQPTSTVDKLPEQSQPSKPLTQQPQVVKFSPPQPYQVPQSGENNVLEEKKQLKKGQPQKFKSEQHPKQQSEQQAIQQPEQTQSTASDIQVPMQPTEQQPAPPDEKVPPVPASDSSEVFQSNFTPDTSLDTNKILNKEAALGKHLGDIRDDMATADDSPYAINPIHQKEETEWDRLQAHRVSKISGYCSASHIPGDVTYVQTMSGATHTWSGNYMVDDVGKVIFCGVPKTATTYLKLVLANVSGNVFLDEHQSHARLQTPHRWDFLRKGNILPLNENDLDQIEYKASRYKKFIFTRNPIDRFVAAYREKLQDEISLPGVAELVLRYAGRYSPEFSTHSLMDITFDEFVKWFLEYGHTTDSWSHYYLGCVPCFMNYDYIGHVEDLDRDVYNIIDRLYGRKAAEATKDTAPYIREATKKRLADVRDIADQYMNQLEPDIKEKLLDAYNVDIALFDYEEST